MQLCIAVYPDNTAQISHQKLMDYLKLAKQYGIQEVFTSIHLPEHDMDKQVEFLKETAFCAKELQLEISADIGGPFIRKALSDQETLALLKQIPLDFLRLDYGYEFEQLKTLYHELHLKGFIINASMVSETELEHHLHFFTQLDENIILKACHNFYVREETGLDTEFALAQSALFEKHHIPVYYCAPCYDHPRAPLHLGLPTIEAHRWQALDSVLLDLVNTYHAQSILFSDEWMSETQFELIERTLSQRLIEIPVICNENLTEMEKRIILKNHIFRYDSNRSFLRSRSSREMAEFAAKIPPKNCIERTKGDITIDNERYLRYSGELQVVTENAKQDDRVNVAAHLKNPNDLQKLAFFRAGYTYKFIEAE